MAHESDYLVKVVLIGVSKVGKSALLIKATDNKFPEKYDATIGVEFGTSTIEVEGKKIRLQIWDTAGEEAFRSITRAYFRDAQVVCPMWDAGATAAVVNLQGWVEEAKALVPENAQFVFVRTKKDLDKERELTQEEIEGQKQEIKKMAGEEATFVETSAKTGENVEAFLKNIAKNWYAAFKLHNGDGGLVPVRNPAPVVPAGPGFWARRIERMSHSRSVRQTHLYQEKLDSLWLKLHLASVENNCSTAASIRSKLDGQAEGHQLTPDEQEKYKAVIWLLQELDSDERHKGYKFLIFFTPESFSERIISERDQQVRQEILNMAGKVYNLIKKGGDVLMLEHKDVYEEGKETLPVVRAILEKAYPSLRPVRKFG